MREVCVIDYAGGNLASAAQAARRAIAEAGLPLDVVVTNDPARLARADRLILPGQGAFADCVRGLRAIPGVWEVLGEARARGVPTLGICVGMQLLAERGLEHGVTDGFGWIRGEVAEMHAPGLRMPHMGWNELIPLRPHPLLQGLPAHAHAYFVHSYALRGWETEDLVASAEYGGTVPAIVARGSCCGTQFHVEKSQDVGLAILTNFLRWTPAA